MKSALCGVVIAVTSAGTVSSWGQERVWEFGSQDTLRTRIEQREEGALTRAGMEQVSLLATQIVLHVNRAAEQFVLEDAQAARKEVERAAQLVELIRSILPVRIVTTTVQDAENGTPYACEERIYPDVVPVVLTARANLPDPKGDSIRSLRDAVEAAGLTLDLAVVERAIAGVKRDPARPKEAAELLVTAQREALSAPEIDRNSLVRRLLNELEAAEDDVQFGNPVEVAARLHRIVRTVQTQREALIEIYHTTDAAASAQVQGRSGIEATATDCPARGSTRQLGAGTPASPRH